MKQFHQSLELKISHAHTNSTELFIEASYSSAPSTTMTSTLSSNLSNVQSSSRSIRVTLERNGKRVELNARQVIAENLRKMFQV